MKQWLHRRKLKRSMQEYDWRRKDQGRMSI